MKTLKLCLLWLLAGVSVLGPVPRAGAQANPDDASTNVPALEQDSNAASAAPSAPAESTSNWKQPQPIVQMGQDVVLKADEEAEAVVVVGGSRPAIGGRHRRQLKSGRRCGRCGGGGDGKH